MKISMNADALRQLTRALDQSEDAEPLGDGEYTLDLYDANPPMTLELEILKDGVDVLAAAELVYHQEMDGWYLEARITDADLLRAELERFCASAAE